MNTRPDRPLSEAEIRLNELLQHGRYAEAIDLYGTLPKSQKRQVGVINSYACALILSGDHRRAARVLGDIPYREKTADVWNNLCAATQYLGKLDDTLASLERGLKRFPGNQGLLLTKSKCLNELNRLDDAYDAALAAVAAAEDETSLFAAGYAAMKLRNYDNAIDFYRRVLALNPAHGQAGNNLNAVYMQTRRFGELRSLAEVRMRSPENRELYRRYFSANCRPWDGGSLEGHRLHVIGDQGVGDAIMYTQFLLALARFNPGKVSVYLDPRLLGLYRNFVDVGFDLEFAEYPRTPQFEDRDLKVSLSSLPNCTLRDERDFPRRPFISVPPEGDKFLTRVGRPVFGLSWWSSGLEGSHRSLEPAAMAGALCAQDADFLSLQYDPDGANLSGLKAAMGDRLIVLDDLDCTDDFAGFAKTAMRLDGIVSIPNTTVHVAGAIGAPTGVLLPPDPSWRYISPDEHMIWYGDHVSLIPWDESVSLEDRIRSFIERTVA